MKKIHRNTFCALIAFLLSVYFLACTSKEKDNNNAGDSSNSPIADPNIIPQFVNVDYIDISKICQITKFRSGVGHDYSDDFEKCRSMKHYYMPCSAVDWSSIKIFSPVSGTIVQIYDELAGKQIQIQSDQYPNFVFIIFHINTISSFSVGNKVTAGMQLGTHIGSQTMSDIAVAQNTTTGRKLISYFKVISDELLKNYQLRGMVSRDDASISAEARNNNPLNCNGDTFSTSGTIENWFFLK